MSQLISLRSSSCPSIYMQWLHYDPAVCLFTGSAWPSLMQEQLTPSPFPLTSPAAGAEKQAHDVLWKKSNIADLLPAIKVKVSSPADSLQWEAGKGHTPAGTRTDTLTLTDTSFSLLYTGNMPFRYSFPWSSKVKVESLTCKSSFPVHLDCRVHGLLPWDGQVLDLFRFLFFCSF